LRRGNVSEALGFFFISLKFAEETGNRFTRVSTLINIAEACKMLGKYKESLEFSNQAMALSSKDDGEIFWKIRTLEGQAHRALHQPDEAQRAFAEAITAIEDLRNYIAGNEQQQQQFFSLKISPYYEMIDLLMAQNHHQEALGFAERSKSRVLFDVLNRGKVNITKALSSDEQHREAKLAAELASLNSQLYQEKQASKPDPMRLAELATRLEKARLQIEALYADIYAAHPELRVQRGEMRPLGLAEAASLIPDNQTALLEFVVQENHSFLFVLTRSNKIADAKPDLQAYQLNIKQKELSQLTQRFNQRIANRSLDFQDSAAQLYNLLLKPAQAQLRGRNSLIIVPDGILWDLPFQALLSAPKRFLLDDYAISYAPSLTVLKEMQSLRAKRRNHHSQAKTLLALGNPAIDTQTAEKVTAVFMDEKLLPLPEAERQVKVLRQIYGDNHSRVYIGAQASETRLKQEAADYQILHLATHGILNDASPMYSHLVLSQQQGKAADDGLLEAWEIMKMDLNADLVILSACDTARGKVGAGEGMIGLAWSLFVAGCPTTVVSQWKVETESNSEMMIVFHRNLRAGARRSKANNSKAAALRQAALKLRRNKKYSHPFYWAPFVIVGDSN
jgi:CHAT domain-containing protein